MRWFNDKFKVVAVAVTIVLVVTIHGCNSTKCKHDYQTVKEITSTIQYDGYWEKGVKKFKEAPRTYYHLRCRQCGDMKIRKLHQKLIKKGLDFC